MHCRLCNTLKTASEPLAAACRCLPHAAFLLPVFPAHGHLADPETTCADCLHSAADLPGFTRSVYERNYALVTPESLVIAGNPRWANASTAHIISPAVGANFAMALVSMRKHSHGTAPPSGHERWVRASGAAGLERRQLHRSMVFGPNCA